MKLNLHALCVEQRIVLMEGCFISPELKPELKSEMTETHLVSLYDYSLHMFSDDDKI